MNKIQSLLFLFLYVSSLFAQNLHFYIDQVHRTRAQTNLVGWVFMTNSPSSEVEMFFYVGDSTQKVIPQIQNRPDVTAHFNDGTNYDQSGFYLEIPSKILKSAQQDLFVVLQDQEGKRIESLILSLKAPPTMIEVLKENQLLILIYLSILIVLFLSNKYISYITNKNFQTINKINSLTGLRFIAALGVIISHRFPYWDAMGGGQCDVVFYTFWFCNEL